MQRQRRRDTGPELLIRQLLHARGLRYRVAWPIPGLRRRTVDIAFTRARLAVFIDGCFWHGCPQHGTLPKANADWWSDKLTANRERDLTTANHLLALDWAVMRIWEHEDAGYSADRIARQLAEINGTLANPPACWP
jgi:DNA mismatch endonuclease, patch repair protein